MTTRNAGSFLSFAAVLVAASMLVGCVGEIDRLSEKLQDPDPTVRWDAAEALGETGSKEAVDPLIKALGDKDLRARPAPTGRLRTGREHVPGGGQRAGRYAQGGYGRGNSRRGGCRAGQLWRRGGRDRTCQRRRPGEG